MNSACGKRGRRTNVSAPLSIQGRGEDGRSGFAALELALHGFTDEGGSIGIATRGIDFREQRRRPSHRHHDRLFARPAKWLPSHGGGCSWKSFLGQFVYTCLHCSVYTLLIAYRRYGGKPVKSPTQKDRWNDRAARYEALAARLSAKASAMLDGSNRDHAFLTQPGHIPARARMIARDDRAFAMMTKADGYVSKAAILRAMASRNKGDAERAREAVRASLDISVGSMTDSIWGRRRVTKLNTKTVRLEGISCPVDRAHLRAIAI